MAPPRDGDDPSERHCRRCGSDVPAAAQFCPSCGSPPDAPEQPLLCGNCGHTVEPGQKFCVACGTSLQLEGSQRRLENAATSSGTASGRRRFQQSPPTSTSSSTESDVDERTLKAFRRRLDRYLENGWEIDRDDGDRVELTYRDFGSIGIHVSFVLFLLTIGWANVLYAVYSVLVRRDKVTLRADDDYQRWPAYDPRPTGGGLRWALGVTMVLFTLLIVQTAIGDPTNPISWLWLAGSLTATACLLPPISRRLRDRGSVSEFGWTTSTDERLVHDSVQCTICWSFVDVAVERSFEKYFAIAGARVRTTDSGQNYYCEDCCETALSTGADRELSDLLAAEEAEPPETDRQYSTESDRW